MNLIKKFFAAFFLAAFILNLPNVTFAEVKEISAEGEYRLGDRDTRETAKTAALADARRKIIEQVGIYVESYSEMNKFNLSRDDIKTAAAALIKIKHEEVHFYEEGTICRAFVVASIDTKNIDKFVHNPDNIPAPNPNPPANTKNLKLIGIEEFNGHYYKVFNDGMDWQDAKKTCEDMGGHLVTITSIIEQEAVKNLVVANGTKGFYWTGGVRVDEKIFKWITGENFTYSNWGNGEPNNSGGNENLIAIYKYSEMDGVWFDMSEAKYYDGKFPFYHISNSGFICEWESYDDIKI